MIRRVIDDSTPDEQHYTIPRAAELMGISQTKLRGLVNNKQIGYYDAAGENATQKAPRIPISEIRRYINARYVAPEQAAS